MITDIGIITYDHPHLKTEQIVTRLARDETIRSITLFALPFVARKGRDVAFQHRPEQTAATSPANLAGLDRVRFETWGGKSVLPPRDIFVITGAGIIDVSLAGGVKVLNAHPGIIPLTRGLDSFKWAIYHGREPGITLHYVDDNVDMGELVTIVRTPVFTDDTIETLARRHYELEIDVLADFRAHIATPDIPTYPENPSTMRMPIDTESDMLAAFDAYKAKFAISR